MYIEIEDLKAYLRITKPVQDEVMTSLILAAQTWIETRTRRKFECLEDTVQLLDPTLMSSRYGRTLRLNEDLVSIEEIINGDGIILTPSVYVTRKMSNGIIYEIQLKASTGIYWTYDLDPEEAISIEGKWAYSIFPPEDIIQATRRLASYLFWQKDNANDLDRPFILGMMTSLPPSLPRDVIKLVDPYIRRSFRS